MSTYCVSKAKLFVQCEDLFMFRKGDFFHQPHIQLQDEELKGLLDTCQQAIQGRGFCIQKPFAQIQLADVIHFMHLCHFSVHQQKSHAGQLDTEDSILELQCTHAMIQTTTSVFVLPNIHLKYHPQKDPFVDENTNSNENRYPKLLTFPRIITAQQVGEGEIEDCVYRLFQNCESAFLITYKFLFICFAKQDQRNPCLILSLEGSLPKDIDARKTQPQANHSNMDLMWFLCTFWGDTHKNLGIVDTDMTVQQFEDIAKKIASKMLSTSREIQNS